MSETDEIIEGIGKLNKGLSYDEKANYKPSASYKLMYDSSTETLEPVYFWLLDFMNDFFPGNVEKITDNFASSPGSGHFSELQGKASQMQQESSRVLGTVNNILKGVLNLIYDLKEFKIRLSHYDAANSKDKSKKEAGILSLKQIWMDKVDIQRGQGSLNALSSGNLQFVTLRDAFMVVNSPEEVDKLDLNERVKRILKPRVQEFFEWKKTSEQELRKRFEIEKIYLKSQVEALKLNSRWAKPYLRAAQQLSTNEKLAGNPALVTAFNTIMLELALMGKNEVRVKDAIGSRELPRDFIKIKKLRKYYSLVFIEFKFRGIPSKSGQHYTFGGRADVEFKAYALNEDELALFKDKLDQSDLAESLKFVQGMTDDSLGKLQIDIDELTIDKEDKEEEDLNPFSALFSVFKVKEKKPDKKYEKEKLKRLKEKGVKRDNYAETYIRSLARAKAMDACYTLYDLYKKGHGMAAFPYKEESEVKLPKVFGESLIGKR